VPGLPSRCSIARVTSVVQQKSGSYCKDYFMPERLVDVEKQDSRVLHTFPVTISAPAEEQAFKEKALEAAGNAKLVPNDELESLDAKMHVSRGGQLTPFGDPHGVLAETKAGLDQVVRERAYLLWEQAGRPDGSADDYWHQAQHQRFCERAYALWERKGCPEGKSDEHWFRTRAFEES
jgi:Protein of unknown function (DUF2934)